ncbi:hypothetical protein VNO77_27469 [Canavalia gladiata]|uniref:Uncharacterized protein n=1 Tax=Canavalia gladiata TaxID=3824 RepID=A0AAN9KU71_CANGL
MIFNKVSEIASVKVSGFFSLALKIWIQVTNSNPDKGSIANIAMGSRLHRCSGRVAASDNALISNLDPVNAEGSNSGSNIKLWIRVLKVRDNVHNAIERSHTRFNGFSSRDTSMILRSELPGKTEVGETTVEIERQEHHNVSTSCCYIRSQVHISLGECPESSDVVACNRTTQTLSVML